MISNASVPIVDKEAYLLLGSNMGNRKLNLEIAIAAISQQFGVLIAESSVYETAAWGKTDQPSFLNQAVMVKSNLPALQILKAILAIEKNMGRVRLEKWGQRLIDIDLIFYGEEVMSTIELTLPHSEMHKRKFVLVPLNEIAPSFQHPIFKQKISKILFNLNDDLPVNQI